MSLKWLEKQISNTKRLYIFKEINGAEITYKTQQISPKISRCKRQNNIRFTPKVKPFLNNSGMEIGEIQN